MPGRVPMTAKCGPLHDSRNRLRRTERLEPMPAGAAQQRFQTQSPQRLRGRSGGQCRNPSGTHPPQAFRCPSGPQCTRTGIDAVLETPVNPMASAASAIKRKPGARAWQRDAPVRAAPSPLPVSLWSRSAEAALCLCRSETDPCRRMRQGSVRPPV